LVKEEQMLNKAHSRADLRFLFLSLLFNSAVSVEIILTGNVWRKNTERDIIAVTFSE
jgi:hypothetical protein